MAHSSEGDGGEGSHKGEELGAEEHDVEFWN